MPSETQSGFVLPPPPKWDGSDPKPGFGFGSSSGDVKNPFAAPTSVEAESADGKPAFNFGALGKAGFGSAPPAAERTTNPDLPKSKLGLLASAGASAGLTSG
jgi:hypothetical protein